MNLGLAHVKELKLFDLSSYIVCTNISGSMTVLTKNWSFLVKSNVKGCAYQDGSFRHMIKHLHIDRKKRVHDEFNRVLNRISRKRSFRISYCSVKFDVIRVCPS